MFYYLLLDCIILNPNFVFVCVCVSFPSWSCIGVGEVNSLHVGGGLSGWGWFWCQKGNQNNPVGSTNAWSLNPHQLSVQQLTALYSNTDMREVTPSISLFNLHLPPSWSSHWEQNTKQTKEGATMLVTQNPQGQVHLQAWIEH